jgi:hypothetical protein
MAYEELPQKITKIAPSFTSRPLYYLDDNSGHPLASRLVGLRTDIHNERERHLRYRPGIEPR